MVKITWGIEIYEYQAISVSYLGSFISHSIRKIENGGKDQQWCISLACGKITQLKKLKKKTQTNYSKKLLLKWINTNNQLLVLL